ncbi:MAG: BrnA antitoxin family protein [Paracoccaceae bacterium]|nr:BrnA antitoxin family protein [Paracoccaceae bacterium]
MGTKKKRRREEARIRDAMAALVAAAREHGETARTRDLEASRQPEAASPRRRTRGPQKAPTKEPVSIRLDKDVVAELRSGGRGWQTRLNAMLRRALDLDGQGGSREA